MCLFVFIVSAGNIPRFVKINSPASHVKYYQTL